MRRRLGSQMATVNAKAQPVGPAADVAVRLPPPTRYQGSKRKLCPWIAACLGELAYDTVLDAFGGTGSVAYMLKGLGKRVTYNDVLRANEQVGIALVENDRVQLSQATIDAVSGDGGGADLSRRRHPTLIADTFAGIYFTDDENAWLDRACACIAEIPNRHERALAWYALFQSALAKRPYNLFHRRNLYMRTAEVSRSFGNKRSWDRLFAEHFERFAAAANAAVIDGGGTCRVVCGDACAVAGEFDLVYIDPPYISARGIGVDYAHFYHFLEGLVDYDAWAERIDHTSKHRRMHAVPSPWTNPRTIAGAFDAIFARYRNSQLAVSYRNDGVPTIDELAAILRRHGRKPRVHELRRHQYALSTRRETHELFITAK